VLRRKRKNLGLTQEQLAQRVGLDQSRISRIEGGLGTPKDYPTAKAIAESYRLDPDETRVWYRLLYGQGSSESNELPQILTDVNFGSKRGQQGYAQAQTILSNLVEGNSKNLNKYLGQYLNRQTINTLESLLSDPLLSESDRRTAMLRLQGVYDSSPGDSFENLAVRQHTIYLLGNFAASETFDLISTAWRKEKHPWILRGALVVLSDSARYEEFLDLVNRNDLARQVARTYPRVYYGDQPHTVSVFLDDGRPTYSRTLRYYLSNHPRYLSSPGQALALTAIRDMLEVKGVGPSLDDLRSSILLYRALNLQPIHPLAKREWNRLRRGMMPIYDELQRIFESFGQGRT
jgi:transcriptional regulator with XRE-family HTH domain